MPTAFAADGQVAKKRGWIVPIAALLPALVALVYVIARGARVGFTHDEAHTFLWFVGAPLSTTLAFGGAVNANNHTLNTLLMALSRSVFGSSELALRLPNVLAFVGFGGAVWSLSRRFRTVIARIAANVLLVLNPFLLEVFSLARGYGLGLCLATTSLALLAAALDTDRTAPDRRRWFLLAGAAAALSVLANLTFLNFYVPFLAVQLLTALRPSPSRKASVHALLGAAAPAALVAIYAARALSRLRSLQELYYGGHTGLWSDTLGSLVRCWLYLQSYGATLQVPVMAAVVIGLGAACVAFARRTEPEARRLMPFARLVAVILAGGIGLILLEHGLFGTPFPINRTAIWLLPITVLLVAAGLDAAASARSAGRDRAFRLLASWELKPSIEYYRATRPLPWLSIVESADSADGAFLSPKDPPLARPMTVWKRYLRTGNMLALARPARSSDGGP